MPLVEAIRGHVFAAERIHADDTTVPVQAKGKTRTGRLWAYVRDDQPFGGPDPPAAAFFYSPDRGGEHPERHLASYVGLMQADAYAGFNRLYEATRKGGPIIEAACWAHGRRKFFDLARLQKAPIAIEAIERIDALFAVEREINGLAPEQRLAVRNERSRPLVVELESWLRQQRAKLSRRSETATATAALNVGRDGHSSDQHQGCCNRYQGTFHSFSLLVSGVTERTRVGEQCFRHAGGKLPAAVRRRDLGVEGLGRGRREDLAKRPTFSSNARPAPGEDRLCNSSKYQGVAFE